MFQWAININEILQNHVSDNLVFLSKYNSIGCFVDLTAILICSIQSWKGCKVAPHLLYPCQKLSCVVSIYKNREIFTFHYQRPFVTWEWIKVNKEKDFDSSKEWFLLIYGVCWSFFIFIESFFYRLGLLWRYIDTVWQGLLISQTECFYQ